MDDIRKKIEKTPALQQAADKLLQDLAKRIPSRQGEEFLSAILDKATEGLNLAEQYPKFEQLLAREPALLRAFQELIELLKQESSEPDGFTPKKKPPLRFLDQSPQVPTENTNPVHAWKVELRQTLENLQSIFTPLSLAYRDPLGAMDHLWYPLLREKVTYEASPLEVALDASISEEQAESLELLLQVVAVQSLNENTHSKSLSATLTWGNYSQSVPLDLNGQTRFPPAEFAQILDKNFEHIDADLTLVIQAAE